MEFHAERRSGSGIPTAGRIIGSIITPMIADRIGRRYTMLVMSIIFIVSIIIEVTSKSYWQIVMGRFINYIPMGIAGALVPVYQVRFIESSRQTHMLIELG